MRKTQVGTGDRSAKIRTYNYPQNRVTDHRINLTLHELTKVVDGDIEPFIDSREMRRFRGWISVRPRQVVPESPE